MIGIVGVAGLTLTGAYFSDTETSTNNIMQAGSLDLILNGVNGDPVEALVLIEDMKPCQVKYSAPIKLHITDNPGRIYKKISINYDEEHTCQTNGTTEPECEAESGTWDGTVCTGASGQTTNYSVYNDLHAVTYFDLAIWVEDTSGNIPVPTVVNVGEICATDTQVGCWKTLIPDGVITVNGIANRQIYLGGADGEYGDDNAIVIRQSFHMKDTAKNQFQSDSCKFKEEFEVVQINNPMTGADVCTPDSRTYEEGGRGCVEDYFTG